MRKLVLIIITLLLSNFSFAQTGDFENYKLSDVGYISIPSKMEIQSGTYKKNAENTYKEKMEKLGFELSDNRIVFQQKGLNDFEKSGFSSYARVILETNISNFGD